MYYGKTNVAIMKNGFGKLNYSRLKKVARYDVDYAYHIDFKRWNRDPVFALNEVKDIYLDHYKRTGNTSVLQEDYIVDGSSKPVYDELGFEWWKAIDFFGYIADLIDDHSGMRYEDWIEKVIINHDKNVKDYLDGVEGDVGVAVHAIKEYMDANNIDNINKFDAKELTTLIEQKTGLKGYGGPVRRAFLMAERL